MTTNKPVDTELVREKLSYCVQGVKRPPAGKLRHAYLVPGGPYSEQWDWDAFFMGVALTAENPSEAIYLKNWTLNFIENAAPDGKVAGCLTAEGWDPRLNHVKPFLAQGAYIAAKALDDFSWIEPVWDTLLSVATYRFRHLWFDSYGLGAWLDSMESGADNNVAALEYPHGSVLAADLNTFLCRECKALGLIAAQLGKRQESGELLARSEAIREAMMQHLWNEDAQIFFNVFTASGKPVKRITYSSFVPLWAGIVPEKYGRASIQRYLLNADHLASPWGFRTLSKQDPVYNNINMIKPHSNWQGPIWPIANYIYMHALIRYGFYDEAASLAQTISQLVLADIERTGGMHENYDAESGEPLAAPNFISWNILVRNMIDEAVTRRDPFDIP